MAGNHFQQGELVASRYLVGKEIGRGGIAIVYAAYDNTLKQDVALKLLVPPPAARDSLRHRFRREASILRELHHPNIVRVHDYVEDGDVAFLVMQLIRGKDLQREVEEGGVLSGAALETLAAQTVSALEAAHRKGILHRDIKPSNILLDEQGSAYLSDFGAAKRDNQTSLITASGLVGTLSYLAPEILEGQRPDTRSDIYSLGLTLYFAAAGKLPPLHRATGIVEPNEGGHVSEHLAYEPIGLLIAKATRKAPSLRFLSANEMLEAVENRSWEDYFSGYSTCPICDSPDLNGDGICRPCLAGQLQEDQLTALMMPAIKNEAEQQLIGARIQKIFGTRIASSQLTQALEGKKALLVLPSVSVAGTVAALERLGVPVRPHPVNSPFALLPKGFQFLTFELILVSIYAAARGFSMLGLGGVVLGIAGLLLGARIVRQPVLVSSARGGLLPAGVADAAIGVASNLRSKGLRRLWGDIVRLSSRAVKLANANSDRSLGEGIGELTRSLGDAVKRLDELEQFLENLENLAHGKAVIGDRLKNGLDNAEQVRAALQDRVFRALSLIGRMTSAKLSSDAGLEQLDAAREVIEEDMQLYSEAREEVERLLAQ